MDEKQAEEILQRYLSGMATEREKSAVETWYNELPYKADSPRHVQQLSDKVSNWDSIAAKTVTVEPASTLLWKKWGVAASIAVAVMAGGYFYYQSKNNHIDSQTAYVNDVAPGKDGATLTLANGKTISLSNATSGTLANEAGVIIRKTEDGQLIYEIKQVANNTNQTNTLATAMGETYRVRLPDGTEVWLNAASTLKYPASFSALKQRKVELNGEAYFEVAKDSKHPFLVKTTNQTVEVLGTHFNIISYENESNTRTTLLEGSVKVSSILNTKMLRPNQQAELGSNGLSVKDVNVDEVVSWKNGMFAFADLPLEEIMKKIARWYNVEVVYNDGVNKSEAYGGSVSRYENVSRVLSKLELTGSVHFKIEGRRIIVTK